MVGSGEHRSDRLHVGFTRLHGDRKGVQSGGEE
jgi:hypothetical protein